MSIRGQQNPSDGLSEFDALAFLIQQMIGRINTATLVKVKAVTNSGAVSPVGFVDVVPLVNQVDGNGNAVPHGTVHSLPYFRMQGGANAVIIDPQVGDIGIAIFADRDISSAIANKAQSNPGTWRRFSKADGLYIGGFLNGTPTQYVQFSAAGIKLHSPTRITMDAPDIVLQAPTIEMNATASITATTPTFTINGNAVINGGISQGAGGSGGNVSLIGPVAVTEDLTAQGKSVHNHTHNVAAVQGGSSTLPTTAPT